MRIEKNIADEIAGRVSRATVIRRDEPLAKHTTLRVGRRMFMSSQRMKMIWRVS